MTIIVVILLLLIIAAHCFASLLSFCPSALLPSTSSACFATCSFGQLNLPGPLGSNIKSNYDSDHRLRSLLLPSSPLILAPLTSTGKQISFIFNKWPPLSSWAVQWAWLAIGVARVVRSICAVVVVGLGLNCKFNISSALRLAPSAHKASEIQQLT